MKKNNPKVMLPDARTEVLTYFTNVGHVVAYCNHGKWFEAWEQGYIGSTPEYWVDLDDLKKELK